MSKNDQRQQNVAKFKNLMNVSDQKNFLNTSQAEEQSQNELKIDFQIKKYQIHSNQEGQKNFIISHQKNYKDLSKLDKKDLQFYNKVLKSQNEAVQFESKLEINQMLQQEKDNLVNKIFQNEVKYAFGQENLSPISQNVQGKSIQFSDQEKKKLQNKRRDFEGGNKSILNSTVNFDCKTYKQRSGLRKLLTGQAKQNLSFDTKLVEDKFNSNFIYSEEDFQVKSSSSRNFNQTRQNENNFLTQELNGPGIPLTKNNVCKRHQKFMSLSSQGFRKPRPKKKLLKDIVIIDGKAQELPSENEKQQYGLLVNKLINYQEFLFQEKIETDLMYQEIKAKMIARRQDQKNYLNQIQKKQEINQELKNQQNQLYLAINNFLVGNPENSNLQSNILNQNKKETANKNPENRISKKFNHYDIKIKQGESLGQSQILNQSFEQKKSNNIIINEFKTHDSPQNQNPNTNFEQSPIKIRDPVMDQSFQRHWENDRKGNYLRLKSQKKQKKTKDIRSIQISLKRKIFQLKTNLLQFIDKMNIFNLKFDQIIENHILDKEPFTYPGSFMFFKYIKEGKIDLIQKMLENWKFYVFQRNEKLMQPIHYAIKKNKNDILEFLIQNHSDLETIDIANRKPLYYACIQSNVQATQLLLYNKASPWEYNGIQYEYLTENTQIHNLLKTAKKIDLMWRMAEPVRKKKLWNDRRQRLIN